MLISLINQHISSNSGEPISGSVWFERILQATIEQQQQTASLLQQLLPAAESSLSVALFLGDRSQLLSPQKKWVEVAGLQHILAVSGYHLTIVTGIFRQFSGLLLRKSWMIALICVLFGGWYAMFSGFSPSMSRAFGMLVVRTIGKHLLYRQISAQFSLVLVCVLSLILRKELLDSLSFQFSYLATFGIITITPLLYSNKNVIADREIGVLQTSYSTSISLRKMGTVFAQAFAVSLGAQLLLVPLILYHFDRFSVLGLLTSTVFFWFIEIIFTTGIISVFLSMLLSSLSRFVLIAQYGLQLLSFLLWVGLSLLNRLLSLFEEWSWVVVQVDDFPVWAVLLWWSAVGSVVLAVWWRRRRAHCYHSLTTVV